MRLAMEQFFERMLAKWAAAGQGLPRAPWDPDADPTIWVGEPDEYEWVTWQPVAKDARHDLTELAPDLGVLHSSISEYFNCFWFAALEGVLGDYAITLAPVLPGAELDDFLWQARSYAEAHDGRLNHVPIGLEADGLLIVVDNHTGEVAVQDWERGTMEVIAPNLEELLEQLEP